MKYMRLFLCLCSLLLTSVLEGQSDKSAYKFTGIVYDSDFSPLPYTHVIASGTGQGDMTDSLGIFYIYIRENDRLSFYNITCHDTVVNVSKDEDVFFIKLKRRIYSLPEAKIFDWGSSYEDFKKEVIRRSPPESIAEKMGLPTQDPDVIPFDRDDEKIKSTGFLINSPVSYLYYNYSKREIGARRAFQLQKDEALIRSFEETLSRENIGSITGLKEKELEEFLLHLNSTLECDYHCGEIELMTEILGIWEKYRGSGCH